MTSTRDGTRFLLDPEVEIVSGCAGTSGCVNGTRDYLHYFRDRYSPARGYDQEPGQRNAHRGVDHVQPGTVRRNVR